MTSHQDSLYCRLCYLHEQVGSVVSSHRIGDISCPELSEDDKAYLFHQRSQQLQQQEQVSWQQSVAHYFNYWY